MGQNLCFYFCYRIMEAADFGAIERQEKSSSSLKFETANINVYQKLLEHFLQQSTKLHFKIDLFLFILFICK